MQCNFLQRASESKRFRDRHLPSLASEAPEDFLEPSNGLLDIARAAEASMFVTREAGSDGGASRQSWSRLDEVGRLMKRE